MRIARAGQRKSDPLECGDLSPLFEAATSRGYSYSGVKPPHQKALTGQRTPKSFRLPSRLDKHPRPKTKDQRPKIKNLNFDSY
jgi:hypothetical protein